MADVKWIKLSVNMFDDEKIKLIRTMPEGDKIIVIWVQLLCLAGKTNDGGSVYMGQNIYYTDEMLATICNQTLNTMRLAISTLEQFGMIEKWHDGLIEITNWEKHQNIDGLDKIRQQNAERNRRYRERKKQKALESNNNDVSMTSRDGTEEDKNRLDIEIDKEKELQQDNNTQKENELKHLDVDDDINQAIDFYQKNFGVVNPYTAQSIVDACKTFSEEVVVEAMKKSLEQGKTTYSYVRGILKHWYNKNVKSIEDINALEVEHQNKQAKKSYNKPQKESVAPKWLSSDQRQKKYQGDVEANAQKEMTDDELAAIEELKKSVLGGE